MSEDDDLVSDDELESELAFIAIVLCVVVGILLGVALSIVSMVIRGR